MLPRVLRLINSMIAIMSILLINYWGLIEGGVIPFNMGGISYLFLEICRLGSLTCAFKADQRQLRTKISCNNTIVSMTMLSTLYQSFASKDGCEGCYSVLQACFGVMVLLNCLEIIVAILILDDPSRSGDIELMVGNSRVRVALEFFGGVTGVLIRCGRLLGGFDGLVAWRLGLGTMGAALLTLVLGAFGSVMTANVFRTCVGLVFLETILVCASRQKMLNMCMRIRYVIFSGFKIGLVIFSIMNDNLHSLTKSSECIVGSGCYSRLRECFWVMLVFYFLELFLAALLLFVHHPRQEIHFMANYVMANLFGVILTMSMALSMTHVAIVGLLLGGSYGLLMTTKGFWLCAITGFVEMAALMGITDWVGKILKTLVHSGMSLTEMAQNTLSMSAFIMVPVLRIVGLFIVANFLDARNAKNYFIADMSKFCDETCQARGRDLLAICACTVLMQGYLSLLSVSAILS